MSNITFDILARDHASAVNKKIGDSFESLETRVTRSMKRAAAAIGIGFGVEKIVEFGKASVDAFEKTEAGEKRLEDAFARFPKLADTNIVALRKLNDQIESRTGFLSRDVAAGEANLAQFKLTGQQLTEITPLLVDYADKTGLAIPEAATLLGRALLGNQRALKSIGIVMPAVTASARDLAKAHHDVESSSSSLAKAQDHLRIMEAELAGKRKVTVADELRYRDAQDAVRTAYAKNREALAKLRAEQDSTARSGSYFDQVITGLRGKVGGFADKESQFAQGQVRKLSAEFDKVKVEIGAQLLPKLLELGHFLTGTFIPDVEATGRFLQHNSDVIVPLAKFVGVLGTAVIVTNKATSIWNTTTRAAATWTRLLGNESVVTATKVATVGPAGVAAQAEVVGATEAGTTAIEAEGDAAVATAGKIGLAARSALTFLGSLSSYVTSLGAAGPMGLAAMFAGSDVSDRNGKNEGALQSTLKKFFIANGQVYAGSTLITDQKVIAAVKAGLIVNKNAPENPNYLTLVDAAGAYFSPKGGDDAVNAELAMLTAALFGKNLGPLSAGTFSDTLSASRAAAIRKTGRDPNYSFVGAASHMSGKIKDILAGLPQFAVGSGTGIADGIARGIRLREQAALSAAKSLASKLQSQISAITSTLTSFKDTVSGTITGNAGLLNSGNQTVAGLIHFERHQLSIDQAFHNNLAKMAKLRYAATYISELAEAGPQQAGNIAAQLVTASVAQRNELNRDARAIAASARATADVSAQAIYAKSYAELKKQTAELILVKKEIKQITTDLETLARTGHLQTTVRRP